MASEYETHEVIYQWLKATGASGWGGASFQNRMKGWARNVEWALKLGIFPQAPAALLDLGCGAGDSSLPFARLLYTVSGVDISATAVEWAREKHQNAGWKSEFKAADISKGLPWDDDSFDVVVDSATLHCIIGEDRATVFAELRRVIKAGGYLMVSSMVGDPKEAARLDSFDPVTRLQRVEGLPTRYLPKVEDLKSEISQEGFELVAEQLQNNPWWDHYTALAKRT